MLVFNQSSRVSIATPSRVCISHMTLTALNVLRMVKLFGWESKMSGRVSERRDEELAVMLKRKLLELVWSELK
jgi:hypothetical protein